MTLKIDEKIIRETTRCDRKFLCLKTPSNIYCQVKDCINEEVLFVKCEDTIICNYKMSFGNSFVCNCPTRKEIYNLHKI